MSEQEGIEWKYGNNGKFEYKKYELEVKRLVISYKLEKAKVYLLFTWPSSFSRILRS